VNDLILEANLAAPHHPAVLMELLSRRVARAFSLGLMLCMFGVPRQWAQAPKVEISNSLIHATIYTPDAAKGFYRGTRFDWSGMIGNLVYAGHTYYAPWFTKTDPTVNDFVYRGDDIVAGPCSAAMGPAEEFVSAEGALGFDKASPGGTFVKIGVGVLRRPDTAKYNRFHLYEVVDPGKWSVQAASDAVHFAQDIADPGSGYGYRYEKTVRLVTGKPELIIEHKLTNTGKRAIESTVYDHNFLVLDGQPTGPAFTVTTPFVIQTKKPSESAAGVIEGNQITYRRNLDAKENFATDIAGFGATSKDYNIRVENKQVKAGVVVQGDRPLDSEVIWSIRSVVSVEPFVRLSIQPGQSFTWKYSYTYYLLR
jgi:hypothetical protein